MEMGGGEPDYEAMEVDMRSDEALTASLIEMGMREDKSLAEVLTELEDAAAVLL